MPFGQVTRIATLGPFTPSTRPGRLDRIVVNSKGSGTNILRLYDGVDATGRLLATLDCTSAPIGPIIYDVVLAMGLFANYTGGMAGDLTIVTD